MNAFILGELHIGGHMPHVHQGGTPFICQKNAVRDAAAKKVRRLFLSGGITCNVLAYFSTRDYAMAVCISPVIKITQQRYATVQERHGVREPYLHAHRFLAQLNRLSPANGGRQRWISEV